MEPGPSISRNGKNVPISDSFIENELLFLIAKYLSLGPYKKAYKVLKEEVENQEILPTRTDWLGNEHSRSFDEFDSLNSHITPKFLLKLVKKLDPAVQNCAPTFPARKKSLFGRGTQSLLRKSKYPSTLLRLSKFISKCKGNPSLEAPLRFSKINKTQSLVGREFTGITNRKAFLTNDLYSRVELFTRNVGHLSAVYCLLFDQTGRFVTEKTENMDMKRRYIITGADDLLVKIWSVQDGRLLATLRGASSEITDLAIDCDNQLLAAGSCDKIIRVWNLQTLAPVAVLSSHTGMITALQFCPTVIFDTQSSVSSPVGKISAHSPVGKKLPKEEIKGKMSKNSIIKGKSRRAGEEKENSGGRKKEEVAQKKIGLLISTGGDGCVAFWTYTKTKNNVTSFEPKPYKLNERVRPGRAELICASFSTGGRFLAIGGADHIVRVYRITSTLAIVKLVEMEAHSDRVDSIQWRHRGIGFVSGSRDGTALVWHYECQQWKTMLLDMNKVSNGVTVSEDAKKRLQVNMVGWTRCDRMVMTSSSDNVIRVWDSENGSLKLCLQGHEDSVYVIEAHPIHERIILTAGHDGLLFIWDIETGKEIKSFRNSIEGQGHGALFDAKWDQRGLSIAATDSHGHILIFGIGDNHLFLKIPQELFFHTDYRPLVRDSNHHVLDEQTQRAPHLMPPPFLVNIDGDPYPPEIQRLVPGRDKCRVDQLIPNVVTHEDGEREVLDFSVAEESQNRVPIGPMSSASNFSGHLPLLDIPHTDLAMSEAGPYNPNSLVTIVNSQISTNETKEQVAEPGPGPSGVANEPFTSSHITSLEEQDSNIKNRETLTESDLNSLETPENNLKSPVPSESGLNLPEQSTPGASDTRLTIDDMIERFEDEQRKRRDSGRDNTARVNSERRDSTSAAQPSDHSYAVSLTPRSDVVASPRASRVGSRREGDIEGVRQSTGNWQRGLSVKWKRPCLLPFNSKSEAESAGKFRAAHLEIEDNIFQRESSRRPKCAPNSPYGNLKAKESPKKNRRKAKKGPPALSTREKTTGLKRPNINEAGAATVVSRPNSRISTQRAFSDEAIDTDGDSDSSSKSSSTSSSLSSEIEKEELEESSNSSDSDASTDYSDWTAAVNNDEQTNKPDLNPPTRTAHKQVRVSKRKKKTARNITGEDTDPEDTNRANGIKDSENEENKENKNAKTRKKVRKTNKSIIKSDDEDDGTDTKNASDYKEETSLGKRRRRKPRKLVEEDHEPVKRSRRKKGAQGKNLAESDIDDINEIPVLYRPPEWLMETVPKKAPYFPQMGDEVIYFLQGHQLYVQAVSNSGLYSIDKKNLPWVKKPNMKDQLHVKIIGIKYEICPPRICCLKLCEMDGKKMTSEYIMVKYHDMADVLDFLVLKSNYDAAMARNWCVGDRFRCIIDDAWWLGVIQGQGPSSKDYPDSVFMCYCVVWDNGERERLSAWDMEPIDPNARMPTGGGCIRVSPAEYKKLVYTPSQKDWANNSFEAECRRMAQGMGRVMELSVAEPFIAPVDLNDYPNYAMIVQYPIDLSTIKSRLESHFYRRPTAAQFDARYVATNAELFNKAGTGIVKNARVVTELMLKLISDTTCTDPTKYYHEMMERFENDENTVGKKSDKNRKISPSGRKRLPVKGAKSESRKNKGPKKPWPQQCRDLLKRMFERQDSVPFRFPVDLYKYEDYNQVIDVPMDLSTIREELAAGGYSTPQAFAKDVRIIFTNSKNYNTNNKSRIYSITVRLEAFFEDQFKSISARSKGRQGKRKRRSGGPASHSVNSISSVAAARLKSGSSPIASTSSKSPTRDEKTRRSKRVAKLRRNRRFKSSDDEKFKRSQRLLLGYELEGEKSAFCSKYEQDSDYATPTTSRRNSISGSARKNKRNGENSEDDYGRGERSEVKEKEWLNRRGRPRTIMRELSSDEFSDENDKIEVSTSRWTNRTNIDLSTFDKKFNSILSKKSSNNKSPRKSGRKVKLESSEEEPDRETKSDDMRKSRNKSQDRKAYYSETNDSFRTRSTRVQNVASNKRVSRGLRMIKKLPKFVEESSDFEGYGSADIRVHNGENKIKILRNKIKNKGELQDTDSLSCDDNDTKNFSNGLYKETLSNRAKRKNMSDQDDKETLSNRAKRKDMSDQDDSNASKRPKRSTSKKREKETFSEFTGSDPSESGESSGSDEEYIASRISAKKGRPRKKNFEFDNTSDEEYKGPRNSSTKKRRPKKRGSEDSNTSDEEYKGPRNSSTKKRRPKRRGSEDSNTSDEEYKGPRNSSTKKRGPKRRGSEHSNTSDEEYKGPRNSSTKKRRPKRRGSEDSQSSQNLSKNSGHKLRKVRCSDGKNSESEGKNGRKLRRNSSKINLSESEPDSGVSEYEKTTRKTRRQIQSPTSDETENSENEKKMKIKQEKVDPEEMKTRRRTPGKEKAEKNSAKHKRLAVQKVLKYGSDSSENEKVKIKNDSETKIERKLRERKNIHNFKDNSGSDFEENLANSRPKRKATFNKILDEYSESEKSDLNEQYSKEKSLSNTKKSDDKLADSVDSENSEKSENSASEESKVKYKPVKIPVNWRRGGKAPRYTESLFKTNTKKKKDESEFEVDEDTGTESELSEDLQQKRGRRRKKTQVAKNKPRKPRKKRVEGSDEASDASFIEDETSAESSSESTDDSEKAALKREKEKSKILAQKLKDQLEKSKAVEKARKEKEKEKLKKVREKERQKAKAMTEKLKEKKENTKKTVHLNSTPVIRHRIKNPTHGTKKSLQQNDSSYQPQIESPPLQPPTQTNHPLTLPSTSYQPTFIHQQYQPQQSTYLQPNYSQNYEEWEEQEGVVGTRGRITKKVAYNEEYSDEEYNVSCRGRVRKSSTRMKDFISS